MECALKGPALPARQELLQVSPEELANGQITLFQGREGAIGAVSLAIFQDYPYSRLNPNNWLKPVIAVRVQDSTGEEQTCWAYQADLQEVSFKVFNITNESIEIDAHDATHAVVEARKQLVEARLDSANLDRLLSGKIPLDKSEIVQKYFEPILQDIHANAVPLTKSSRELFINSFVEKLRSLPADQRLVFLHQCKQCKVDPEAGNKIGNCLVEQMNMTIQLRTGWDKLVWNRDIPNNQTIFGKLLKEVRQATDSPALQTLLIHHAYQLDWVMADNGHVRKTLQEKGNFAALADKLEQAAQHKNMDSRELTQLYLQEVENFGEKLSGYPISLVVRPQDKADLLKFFAKKIEQLPKEGVQTFLEEFRGSRAQRSVSHVLEKLNNSNLDEVEKRKYEALKAKLNQRNAFHLDWCAHVDEQCGPNALVYNLVIHKMMASDYDLIQDKEEVKAKINQDIEHFKGLTSHFTAETIKNFRILSPLSIERFAKELESVKEISTSYPAVLSLYLTFAENTTKINQVLEQFYADYPGKLQQKGEGGVVKFEFPDYQYDTREQNELSKTFSDRVGALGREFPTEQLAVKPEELLNAISLNFAHVATWLEEEMALRGVEVASKPVGVPLIRAKDFSLALAHPESNGLVKRGDMKKNDQGVSIPETNTEIIEQEGVCMGMSNGYQDHNIKQPNADHVGVALLKAGDYPVTLVVQADGSGHGKEPAQVARAVVEMAIASAEKAFNLPFVNAHDCIQLLLHTMCETTKDIAKKCAQAPEDYQSAATALIGAVVPNKEPGRATAVFGNLGDCGAFIWKKDGTISRIGEDDLSEAYDVQSSGGQYGMNPNIALPNTAGYKFFTAQVEEGDRIITSSDGVIDNLHPRCFIDSRGKVLYNSPHEAFMALTSEEQDSLRVQGLNVKTLTQWTHPDAWNVANPLTGQLVLMHMNKKITAIVKEARATTPKAATEALLTYARERGHQVRGKQSLKDPDGNRVPNHDYFQGLELNVYVDENKIPVKLDDYSVTIVDPFKFANA